MKQAGRTYLYQSLEPRTDASGYTRVLRDMGVNESLPLSVNQMHIPAGSCS